MAAEQPDMQPDCVVNVDPTLSEDASNTAATSVMPGRHMSMLEAVKKRRLCLQIAIVSLLLVGILAISSLAFYFLIMLRREIAV